MAQKSDWIVTSQHRADWPSKAYRFRDQGQARMFLYMCQRDGDHACALSKAAA